MRIRAEAKFKTKFTNSVIKESIKSDKMDWIKGRMFDRNLQKYPLWIHDFGITHLNSGSLTRAVSAFHRRIEKVTGPLKNPVPLIAILVDIAFQKRASKGGSRARVGGKPQSPQTRRQPLVGRSAPPSPTRCRAHPQRPLGPNTLRARSTLGALFELYHRHPSPALRRIPNTSPVR